MCRRLTRRSLPPRRPPLPLRRRRSLLRVPKWVRGRLQPRVLFRVRVRPPGRALRPARPRAPLSGPGVPQSPRRVPGLRTMRLVLPRHPSRVRRVRPPPRLLVRPLLAPGLLLVLARGPLPPGPPRPRCGAVALPARGIIPSYHPRVWASSDVPTIRTVPRAGNVGSAPVPPVPVAIAFPGRQVSARAARWACRVPIRR